MKIVKWLASAILIVILGFVFVAKYSSTTTVYECSGKQDYSEEVKRVVTLRRCSLSWRNTDGGFTYGVTQTDSSP